MLNITRKGDTIDEDSLEKAKIYDAYSVIILADERFGNETDARATITIENIRKICADKNKEGPSIIIEIKDPKNNYLKSYLAANQEEKYANRIEIVSSDKLGQYLLSQSAFTPGLTKIYNELLTFDKKENEIYQMQVPEKFIQEKFSDLIICSSLLRKEEKLNVIPIAVSQNGKICLNPKEDKVLSKDDIIYIICESPEALEKYKKTLTLKYKEYFKFLNPCQMWL